MDTAYNNTTTTIQESRNRYNALLNRALKNINRNKTDKTAQEPEEVTTAMPEEVATTATDVTTTPTQQPEPVATPENVTTEPTEASKPEEVTATAPSKTTKTRRTKTASPKPLGRDIYHIFYEKQSRWAIMFDKSVYHDPEGFALLSDNVVFIESKLDYKKEYSGKLIREDGTESKKDMQLFSKYKDICRPAGGKYAVTPKEIEERIKGEEFARKKRVICSILESDDVTDEEVKIHLKDNKDVRDYVNEQTKTQFVKLLLPAGESVYLYIRHIKRALKVAKTLSTNCISTANRIFQFTGEAGRIIVAGCITRPEDENSMNPLIIDLTDATPAPEDTPEIEKTAPATAPQATEEDTATAPEEVTTEEDATTAPATDDATLLRNLIDKYGNVGADYLDTLDYSQATEIRSDDAYLLGRAKDLKQIKYIVGPEDKNEIYKPFGLKRTYARNGKRMEFVVYDGWTCMESRDYGKNNNHYKATIFYDGNELKYLVKNGIIVEALLSIKDGAIIHVHFNDTNRPETPRDLPAPAPSKTTKEAPATTVQEQPTSKQEGDTTPYWLLLDNELRAQQEEQEQAPATPEKSEELSKKLSDELATMISKRSNTAPEDEEIPDHNLITGTAEWLEYMRATHDFEFTGCTPYNGRTYYSVAFWRKPVELKGRGVERISGYEYSLTKRAFDKVCEEYTYFSDPNY